MQTANVLTKEKAMVSDFSTLSEITKKDGVFDINTLDEELLYYLWGERCMSDSIIGILYGVNKETIRRLRYKYDIKLYSVVSFQACEMMQSMIESMKPNTTF